MTTPTTRVTREDVLAAARRRWPELVHVMDIRCYVVPGGSGRVFHYVEGVANSFAPTLAELLAKIEEPQ